VLTYPPDFTYPERKAKTAQAMAAVIAHLAPSRRAVVQAGGCSGLWPLALSKYFARVYTFEPEPANFDCLLVNITGATNIVAVPCAVGATRRTVGMARPKAGAGLWHVEGDGDVLMVPLDAVMGDETVDAIVLDVEGSEATALRGAKQLIAAHRPLLWFEFLRNTEAIASVLAEYGYVSPRHGIGNDRYSVHSSRVGQGKAA
jgi:FkbM family methyltransferase